MHYSLTDWHELEIVIELGICLVEALLPGYLDVNTEGAPPNATNLYNLLTLHNESSSWRIEGLMEPDSDGLNMFTKGWIPFDWLDIKVPFITVLLVGL